jgi:uncharacterized membrane protein YqhA
MSRIERLFQWFLWNARLIMLIPVMASLLAALVILLLSTLNTLALVQRMISYISLSASDQALQQNLILSDVIGVIDQYLIIAILVIFADGMYELFIGKISVAEDSPIGARLLVVRSLDDLKDRLVGVVLVILVVKFFQQALKMTYETPTDLLLLAAGIAAVGAALFLAGRRSKPHQNDDNNDNPGE